MTTEQIQEIATRAFLMSGVVRIGEPGLHNGVWVVGFRERWELLPLQARLPDRNIRNEADLKNAGYELANA